MRKELPPPGTVERQFFHKEEGEIPARASRVTLVFGSGGMKPSVFATRDEGTLDVKDILTDEARAAAHSALQYVLENVARQKDIDDNPYRQVSYMRDIVNFGPEPIRQTPQPAIGDTIILLGGRDRPGDAFESMALFWEMLSIAPDLPNIRGVEMHLQGEHSSLISGMDYANRVIGDSIKISDGREVESISVFCPPSRLVGISHAIQRSSGLRVDFINGVWSM